MSVAIRAITRVQDADDFGSTPGAGNDGYALTWDNGAGEFVLAAAGVTDHGALTGLSDDDHSQYLLATGARTGASSQAQTFTVGVSTAALTLAGNVTAGTETQIAALTFTNGGNTVAKISTVSTDASQDDGSLVFSTALNGSLTEKFRITRDGIITFPQKVYYYDANSWLDGSGSAGSLQIGARVSTAFYTALNTRNYAYLHRDIGASYIAPNRTTTNDVGNILILRSDIVSGTPAAGYGGGLAFQLQSSTTASQSAALVAASWIVATHASRKARLALSAYDYNGAREGVRIDTDGSAALLGFYGHAATAQQTLATGAGASADDIITALQNLGLVKQS